MDISSAFDGLGQTLGSTLTSSLFYYTNTQLYFTRKSMYSLSNDYSIGCWLLSACLLIISVVCGSTADTLATKQIVAREILRTAKTLLDSMTVITVVASMLMTATAIQGAPVWPYRKKERDPQDMENTDDTTTTARVSSESTSVQLKPTGTEVSPVSVGTPSKYSPF